jgi:hypothetical protein
MIVVYFEVDLLSENFPGRNGKNTKSFRILIILQNFPGRNEKNTKSFRILIILQSFLTVVV